MNAARLLPVLFFVYATTALFSTAALACWPLDERREIEGFAEMEGTLILSFKDAVDCAPLRDARVMLGELEFSTDGKGYLMLPMAPFAAQMDATMPVTVSHPGHITLKTDLIIAAGTVLNRRMVLSRALPPGKTRFVLSWNDEPLDLDLHLKGPGFHISYRNMHSASGNANLDRDELNGFGPETITLHRIQPGAGYRVWVDNFSNDGDFTGAETLSVYQGEHLLQQVRLKPGSHRALLMLKLENGGTERVNQPSPRP